ncbi:MAG: hypothetical protein LBL06_04555 [Treponema sp.]|nr:hypothetical protein [Treponema sp.]
MSGALYSFIVNFIGIIFDVDIPFPLNLTGAYNIRGSFNSVFSAWVLEEERGGGGA